MTNTGQIDREMTRIAEELRRASAGSDPFAAAVRATRMPMVITNPRLPDNPIVFANDAFCVLTGYAREEILGRNCRLLQGPGTDSAELARVREAVGRGRVVQADLLNYRKDGEPFWNRLLMAPVLDSGGGISFFFASQVDVTLERERLESLSGENASLLRELANRLRTQEDGEARLRRTTDVLNAILTSAPALIYAKDREGRMLVANPRALSLIGRPWEEVEGRRDSEFLADAQQGLVIEDTDSRIMAQGVSLEVEEVVSSPGGEPQLWLSTKSPMRDPSGAVTGLVGVSIDITERKRAEEALHELNTTLEARIAERTRERDRAWRLSHNLLLVCDLDGVMQAVSPAWTTMLGWREDELVGRPFAGFIHLDDRRATLEAAAKVASGVFEQGFENRYRHKDGTYRSICWTWVLDDALIYATGRDLTAEKQQKVALAEVEARLMQSQKMEAIGQLTGGIAHDFNNMLQGISGSLELMGAGIARGDPERAARYVEEAMKAVERASGLTHRLLAFARRQALAPKPVQPNGRLDDLSELIRRTVGPQVIVEVVGDEEPWTVMCDPNQLESALINLAINARDAMPAGGALTLRTCNVFMTSADLVGQDGARPGGYVRVDVADTGVGMPPDVAARAFEPFFTTKPAGRGTGLGLSQLYGFAQQSGGFVRLDSAPGQGTTVRVFLPRLMTEATAEPKAEREIGSASPSSGMVLIVDDEEVVRAMAAQVILEAGCEVMEAEDGPSALRLLQSDVTIDMLVTDVGLPGLNGRQLADAARVQRPDLPVLLITGYAGPALEDWRLEPGMEVMTKPFRLEDLAARVGAGLREAGGRERRRLPI